MCERFIVYPVQETVRFKGRMTMELILSAVYLTNVKLNLIQKTFPLITFLALSHQPISELSSVVKQP